MHHLMAARALPGRRLALMDRDFAVHALHGQTARRVLGGADEIMDVLQHEFGIALAEPDAVRRRLQEVLSTPG
jgi:N-hydroxyarylamine O-acetyltransferase